MNVKVLFFSLVLSRFLGGLGFQFFLVAGIDTVYRTTVSPALVGGLGAVLFLPSLFGPLLAGRAIDRTENPGRFFMAVQFFVFLSSLVYCFSIGSTMWVYITAFLLSCLRVLRSPLQYSLTGLLRDKGLDPGQAARAMSLSWQLPLVLGPLLYTATMTFLEPTSVPVVFFICSLASFLVSLPFARVKRVDSKKTSINLQQELRHFWSQSVLRDALLADALVTSLLCFTSLLPFLLHEIRVSSEYLGIIKSASNTSSILLTVILPQRTFNTMKQSFFMLSLVLLSGLVIVISQSYSLFGLLILSILYGAIDGWGVLYRDALLLRLTATENLGMVSSLQQVLISVSDDFGEWRAGVAAESFGIRPAMLFSALIGIAVSLTFVKQTKRQTSF